MEKQLLEMLELPRYASCASTPRSRKPPTRCAVEDSVDIRLPTGDVLKAARATKAAESQSKTKEEAKRWQEEVKEAGTAMDAAMQAWLSHWSMKLAALKVAVAEAKAAHREAEYNTGRTWAEYNTGVQRGLRSMRNPWAEYNTAVKTVGIQAESVIEAATAAEEATEAIYESQKAHYNNTESKTKQQKEAETAMKAAKKASSNAREDLKALKDSDARKDFNDPLNGFGDATKLLKSLVKKSKKRQAAGSSGRWFSRK